MAISSDLRAVVRATFGGRCGYCGVSEESVGGELEAQLHETNLALQAEVARLRALVETLLKREGG